MPSSKETHRSAGATRSLLGALTQPDAVLGVLVVGIIAMMIVPLPTALIDLLIACNLALSVLLLLVSLTVRDGLAFTSMPTLLLVTTLFRLSLNVSSTRLILLQADAGQIIRAFGDFVVRGDYVVGGVLFLVLTLVQYIVVARGAERVAEVGARFSLDALPGKQLAIDADVRSGALSAIRARARREELERESRFYGAMDGAMKFVKGDAIAGIAIAIISFVAGSSLGALRESLPIGESMRLYGLLTIGDALVSQIPSLIIATSAGLVVTRVASGEEHASLAGDLAHQLLGDPRVLFTCSAFFAALMIVPGLPAAPFAALALLLGLAGLRAREERRASAVHSGLAAPADAALVRIELGSELERTLLAEAAFATAVQATAARVGEQLGLSVGKVELVAHSALAARAYRISIGNAPIAHAELADQSAAEATAQVAGRLEQALREHAALLLGVDETQALLEATSKHAPMLVQQLVPQALSLRALTQVLQRLLAEGIALRPLRPILEALALETGTTSTTSGTGTAQSAPTSFAPHELVERVRMRLARQITAAHSHHGTLRAHAVDPMIEDALRDAVQGSGHAAYLALHPDLAADILASARATIRVSVSDSAAAAVLITQPDVRRWLREVLAPELPGLAVLSYSELAHDARIEQLAPVRVGAAA